MLQPLTKRFCGQKNIHSPHSDTNPSPLSFANLFPAVRVFSGIFSVLNTVETQSFKVSCGIWRNWFGELPDVEIGTTTVLAVGASRYVPIPVALDLRQ